MRLRQYFEPYLRHAERMGLAPRSLYHAQNHFKYTIGPTVGDRELRSLKPNDASHIIERAALRGRSAPARAIIVLRALLKYIGGEGIKTPFHYSTLKVPRLPEKEIEYLTKEERKIIRDTIPLSFPWVRFRAMFELGLHTGLRIGEMLNIRIGDIDWINHEIKIYSQKAKQYQTVYTYGSEEEISRYLGQRTDECPYLFATKEGKKIKFNCARTQMIEMRRKLKDKIKKHLHWHILRKTFCTELLLNKTDIKSVQHLARHRSERTTLRHYAAVNKTHCKVEHQRVMGVLV